MGLTNTPNSYGWVTKTAHFLVAVGVILALILGKIIHEDDTSVGLGLVQFKAHQFLGIAVFLLILLRLLWNRVSPKPHPLPTHRRWEVLLASGVHRGFYFALLAMPLTGVFGLWFDSEPVTFGGVTIPPTFVPHSSLLAEVCWGIHEFVSHLLLLPMLILHVAGALKHHYWDKDRTLRRMFF